ncbi:multidrug effflux MFS transporter [Halodurantibacterium flavum]|uniref:Bcr/CflA family efflux transporter n=1 Tax=Halodurantibacterium flavum TaxID=1382802 RepID=A0ABW4S490_9RHOB
MSQLFRPTRPVPFAEFVALMAALTALAALSIDAMLPAIPQIAADLSPDDPNRAQLVVTSFMVGIGFGMLVMGPLSDAIGRRPVIALGVALYVVGALLAVIADSMTMLLAARVLQGLGISAPRTVSVAMIRDRYAGREMARVLSFVMTVFILVPAAAPFLGQTILGFAGWRMIFASFIIFGTLVMMWILLRQPETLAPEARRPFRAGTIAAGMREVVSNRRVMLYVLTLVFGFAQMIALLSASQPVYDVYFGRGDSFAMWFAIQALAAGTAGMLNAALVVRLGMRRMVMAAYAFQIAASALATGLWASGTFGGPEAFPVFFLWAVGVFYIAGLTFGNLNALAIEPLGHIAGVASAVIGAISTVLAVVMAVPVSLAFDGTPLPLMIGVLIFSTLALLTMVANRR